MDMGRLGVVRKQENHHTKYVMMVNETIKNRWGYLNDHLSREKFDIKVKMDKQTMAMRRIVVRQRILKQCMKMRKENVVNSRNRDIMLGQYGGKSLPAFSRDIDKQITYMHPRLRRLRKVQKQISESFEKGKIIDPNEMSRRVKNYFDKYWQEEEVKPKKEEEVNETPTKDIFAKSRGNALPPIRGLMNPVFYKFVEEEEKNEKDSSEKDAVKYDKLQVHNSAENEDSVVVPTGNKDNSQTQSKLPEEKSKELEAVKPLLEKKHSIILPPISMTKDLVKKG